MSHNSFINASEKKAIAGLGGIFALRMLGLFMIVPVFAVYGTQYAHATPFLIGMAIGALQPWRWFQKDTLEAQLEQQNKN